MIACYSIDNVYSLVVPYQKNILKWIIWQQSEQTSAITKEKSATELLSYVTATCLISDNNKVYYIQIKHFIGRYWYMRWEIELVNLLFWICSCLTRGVLGASQHGQLYNHKICGFLRLNWKREIIWFLSFMTKFYVEYIHHSWYNVAM